MIDLAVIDEARELAHKLRERSAQVPVPLTGAEQARELRNRFASMLFDRMTRVRAAARFVFRQHPAIVREATSAYERRQPRGTAPRPTSPTWCSRTATVYKAARLRDYETRWKADLTASADDAAIGAPRWTPRWL